MKVLVTGCLGFIGSSVVPKLLKAGHHVIGFDNSFNPSLKVFERMKLESGETWNNFRFQHADIRNYEIMSSFLYYEKPQAIVHLAALGSVPRSWAHRSEYTSVNITGFENVMELALDHDARFVFASSASVYGNSLNAIKTEGVEGRTLSPYALSKKHNEESAAMLSLKSPLEYIGLRFFNVYGPGQIFHNDFSAVIPRFINGNKIEIKGDGETIRDFTYVEDVADAILLALTCEDKNFVCNIGTGIGTTLKQLASIISAGKKEILHVEERAMDTKLTMADTTRAREKLGFKSNWSLQQGLEKTVGFYNSLRA